MSSGSRVRARFHSFPNAYYASAMEYKPRYAQPFTLEQASLLDVPIITEEIARLQNSLQHLIQTQEQLQEASLETPDPEFTKALEENAVVIGSQQERIRMLEMVLIEKGVVTNTGHYQLESNNARPPERRAQGNEQVDTSSPPAHVPPSLEEPDDGVHL